MELRIFSVYDSKAEGYLPPFTAITKGQAMRTFGDYCNNPEHPFYKHAEDYTLFEIGSYDDSKGTVSPNAANIPLGLALEFKKEKVAPLKGA